MSGVAEAEENGRKGRARHPVLMVVAVGCYVLAVIPGMFLLTVGIGPVVQILLWFLHGVLFIELIQRLGAKESKAVAALVVFTSTLSVYAAAMAHDDLTLQQRGETATVTVVKEWRDPVTSKSRGSHYLLERQDGTPFPGPEMETATDLYDVGQVLTVIADPEGELRPQTPGHADSTAELVGAGTLAAVALGAVGWMIWRGSVDARRQNNHGARQEQEEKLREALRTHPVDRRGYIKVVPEEYPDVSKQRAAGIARELGLRAEAVGNRGSWRFGETAAGDPHG
ncbi:hypothetical protein GCM10022384_68500 [Streptomyces marokkonensis]|uniref:DUF3592 domain-containing protein n=1 Tax=Streptomyces marokkonensis TaxID=324855 RepID=A0ABP7SR83_9ACTN